MTSIMTTGVDHVGLTVFDLAASTRFFTECLGWTVFGQNAAYPAAFVTDGAAKVTLWQVSDVGAFNGFDRKNTVGLHHLALKVPDRAGLDAVFERVAAYPGVIVEFAPELSGTGPRWHAMVVEPGGTRMEFSFDPR
jgi:catechol 2,3-dioxygenase-like lactoylglutathione lyase family enzyme